MKKLLVILVFLIFIIFIFYNAYRSNINNQIENNGDVVSFEIKSGENVAKIISNLISSDLIKSELFFKIYIWQTENETKLQAGIYELNRGMSIVKIVDKLVGGDVLSKEQDIKILEGWDIVDMETYFLKNNILPKDDFNKKASMAISDWSFDFTKYKFLENVPSDVDLEGYLFPDTYRIFDESGAEEIIKKMLDNFDSKLNQELRDEINKQNKIIHDIITMASIIEKEVADENDMAIVAGILYKRMNIGMRLEVDSSINYISGKNDPSVTYVDLQIDSPYNTYKNDGLPPGPICSPGLQAIKAAIYPKKSNYLFYLNRQDTGETIFSKTYNEHLRNKNKYLK